MALQDYQDDFEKIEQAHAKPAPAALAPPTNSNEDYQNDFAKLEQQFVPASEKSGLLGSAVRGAIGVAGPAAGTIAGAEAGAVAGGAIGEAIFPAGGGFLGGIGGAIYGGYKGAEGMSTAQNWALSKVPKIRDLLGQSEEQKRLDEEAHPIATFLGGLAPYAVTMSPFGAWRRLGAIPENETTWQRLARSPLTSRFMSAGVVGAMQLGQEEVNEDKVNWNRVAVATGFGLIWNKPNTIGRQISEFGARPARFVLGRPAPMVERPPTVAETSEQGIGGPGVTEDTFRGSQARNPVAEAQAQQDAITEASLIGPVRRPDLWTEARRLNPELFEQYDAAIERKSTFQSWVNEAAPGEAPIARQHLDAVNAELSELEPRVASAYRAEAVRSGAETVAPAPETPAAPLTPEQIAARGLAEEHKAEIAKQATAQLVRVGEPPERAEMLGQLIANFYAGRAARFGGALGNALDLYKKEGERFAIGRYNVKMPPAKPGAPPPKLPTNAAELRDFIAAGGEVAAAPRALGVPAAAPEQPALPEGITFNTEGPVTGGFDWSHRASLTDQTGKVHYSADLAAVPGSDQMTIQNVTNVSREFKGLAPSFYQRIADYAQSLGKRLTVSDDPGSTTDYSRRLHERLVSSGKADVIATGKNNFTGETYPVYQIHPNHPVPRGPITTDSIERAMTRPIQVMPMPTVANSSRLPGGPVVIDPKVIEGLPPKTAEIYKQALAVHETLEEDLEKQGVAHDRAHHFAEEGERAFIERSGENWEEYSKHVRSREKEIRDQRIDDPDMWAHLDLHRDPMEDVGHHAEKGEIKAELKEDLATHPAMQAVDEFFQIKAANDVDFHGREVAPTYDANLKAQLIDKYGKDAKIGDFEYWKKIATEEGHNLSFGSQRPNAFLAARAHSEGGKSTILIDSEGRRTVYHDGVKVARESRKDLPPPGDEFFQNASDFNQGEKPLGSTRFQDGLRTIVTRFPEADASTIVHELGHSWLDTLLRDSEHPAAPQELQNDAATVLKWLGMTSTEGMKARTKKGDVTAKVRAAHEKFATGFEQYMREGVAPSADLVNVFARFKAWLLDLYTTIKGLGQPISPDIRRVFDRMLMDRNETVIGERTPGGPSLVNIHEADAQTIAPPEAEPAMARVLDERDRYEKEQPPQIKAELEAAAGQAAAQAEGRGPGAEPGRPAATGAGGRGEVVGGGGGAEPESAGGGGGAEPGTVEPGGTPARAESSNVPGVGETSAADREHTLAPRPAADTIRRGDTKLVDKAGNIRVDNLTNREEVAQAIHDSADRNEDFKSVIGDSMPKGMMWSLANDMGLDLGSLDEAALENHIARLLGGFKDLPQKLLAARRLLQQSAQNVADLMQRVVQSDSDEDTKELALAITRHDMIQSSLAGATASWGRTGTAFKDITEGWEQAKNINALLMAKTGRTLFQIKQIAKLGAQYGQTGQISAFIRNGGKPSFGNMVLEYWINGLISGISTHVTYSVGNTILMLEKIGPETALAAGIGAVRKSMGRQGETVNIREVMGGLAGLRRGLAPATQAALEGLRSGVTTLLPGERGAFTQPLLPGTIPIEASVLNLAADWQDVMATAYGVTRGLRDAFVAGSALTQAAPTWEWVYTPRGAIPNLRWGGAIIPLGEVARSPGRMIAAAHSLFRSLNYTAEIGQQAYRSASEKNLAGAHFDAEVASFTANPPVDAMEAARNISTDLTLMGQGAAFTRKLNTWLNHEFNQRVDPTTGKPITGSGTRYLRFIQPFAHISSNIIDQSIVQRTPLGLLSSAIRDDLMGRNGNIAADTAAARMLAGTAMSVLFGGLAAQGYVTGSQPFNYEDAALWRQVYQEHSIRIGDNWYAMNRLGPMGMLLSTAADLYGFADKAVQGDVAGAAAALHQAVVQNILDESFMRGPADLIKAIEDPGRYGDAYIRNEIATFVPFSVAMAQFARASDPYSRQARTIVDAIKAKVPGLSEDLMPRRDIWGEPLPNKDALISAGLTAIYEQKVSNDPVNLAMMQLGMHQAIPERTIRNVKLTDQQYDDWSRLKGRLTKLRLDAIVRSPSFLNLPNVLKHDLITEQQRQAGEVARNMMFMKYPSLLVDAQAVKMRKREGLQ